MTLWDAMIEMYERYGYYKDDIQSITMKGIEGLEKIRQILATLRSEPPKEIAGYKVLKVRDYQADTIRDMETGEVTATGLPNSNVLYYELPDGAWGMRKTFGNRAKSEILLRRERYFSDRCGCKIRRNGKSHNGNGEKS